MSLKHDREFHYVLSHLDRYQPRGKCGQFESGDKREVLVSHHALLLVGTALSMDLIGNC